MKFCHITVRQVGMTDEMHKLENLLLVKYEKSVVAEIKMEGVSEIERIFRID